MSESSIIEGLVRLAFKKGILQGDVHKLQDEALQWALNDEIEQSVIWEKERMKYTILAANPQLYQKLYEEEDEDDIPGDQVEWIVPKSVDEVEKIMEILNEQHKAMEHSDDNVTPSERHP